MNNGSFSTGGQPQNPSFGTVVVTAALQLNAGAVFDLFNTADKTTNYERLRAYFVGNVARVWTEAGGTGTVRNLSLGANQEFLTFRAAVSPSGFGNFNHTATGGLSGVGWVFAGTYQANSSTQINTLIAPTIIQSGTAGYTALDINPTETATGSGTKLLQRWAVGGSVQGSMTSNGILSAVNITSTSSIGLGASLGTIADVLLRRDAADILALRNSTTAQTFRGYETFTDASNYSRWYQSFSGGFAYYGTQAAGTGTRRPLIVQHFTTTVAALPAAATAGAGSRAVVSDATAPVFGAAVVGGGAVVSPVYSDGANWIVG